MDSFYTVFWILLELCISFNDGITVTSLYSSTQSAVLGIPFTLVCTWNHTENSSQNALYIQWFRDNDTEFIFNSESCILETTQSGCTNISRVSYDYGIQYQSLTLDNITASDIGHLWYCSSHGNISKPVNVRERENDNGKAFMFSDSPVVYKGSKITLTCNFLSDTPLSLANWLINNSIYFALGESCSFTPKREDDLDIQKRSYFNCSQNSSQSVTLTNVTMADHDVTWQCHVGDVSSNVWKVIVLDPDLPNNVSISSRQVGHNDHPLILVCTTPCENTFRLSWNIGENVSDIHYDSCKHTCNQTLTIDLEEGNPDEQITCTVTNTRTGKTSSADYLITRDNAVTADGPSTATVPNVTGRTTGQGPGLPIYVWGVAAGGGVIIIIIVVCRKRSSSVRPKAVVSNLSSKPIPVMEDNVLYEHGGPEKRESKLVMEDNILYEHGGPVMEDNILYEHGGPGMSSQEKHGSKLVMENNVLYESGGPVKLNKEVMRGNELGGDENVYEGCDNKGYNEYHTLEEVVQTEND